MSKIVDDVIILAKQQYQNLDLLQSGLIYFDLDASALLEDDDANGAFNNILMYLLFILIKDSLKESDINAVKLKDTDLYGLFPMIKSEVLDSLYKEIIPIGLIYINNQCDLDYLNYSVETWISQMKLYLIDLFIK